jgi:hypothetical protein
MCYRGKNIGAITRGNSFLRRVSDGRDVLWRHAVGAPGTLDAGALGLLGGRIALGLWRHAGFGVGLRLYGALARGPGMGELGTEKADQGRVIDLHQQRHQ